MNNKDFHFTYLAELFSKEIYQKLKNVFTQQMKQQEEQESSGSSQEDFSSEPPQAQNSNFNLDFLLNLNLDEETKSLLFGNSIDQKLDQMLKDWYTSHDILFCIHPLDGSILIWLVDWLDEYMPGSGYRQAQVSFHAKLPNTIPIGDSNSLTNSVFLYIEPVKVNYNPKPIDTNIDLDVIESLPSHEQADLYSYQAGVVNMVTKHSNGTLNLWRFQFQDSSKYQSLINVTHLYRVCGHRFRVSDITSHPILPFLLTNSINDLNTKQDLNLKSEPEEAGDGGLLETFQKGLVIWGVEPVGPLSKSGGIYELARVDSSRANAFENIAWFPCFLPSSTLGTLSASPSTLFASTDSSQITIYQAVFDARTLLHDIQHQSEDKLKTNESSVAASSSSFGVSNTTEIPYNSFNIVSIQSTARPGCIIELEKLADSNCSSWTKADLFHIYQENLIVNVDNEPANNKTSSQFNGTYFLVLLEKKVNLEFEKVSRNCSHVEDYGLVIANFKL